MRATFGPCWWRVSGLALIRLLGRTVANNNRSLPPLKRLEVEGLAGAVCRYGEMAGIESPSTVSPSAFSSRTPTGLSSAGDGDGGERRQVAGAIPAGQRRGVWVFR